MELKTGIVFDDCMAEHLCTFDRQNPECPDRYLQSIVKIKKYNLMERCQILTSRPAKLEELLLLHTQEYIQEVKDTSGSEDEVELEKLAAKYDGVFFNSKTYECALLAAGCTLELVSSVLNGTVKNGMAIVRPPGHHAMEKEACGYCFFNNVALATKLALEKYNLNRVLIVDWDVHHGQATQRAFYDDPRVLYFSIHRYEHGVFWPHLRESNFDFTGGPGAKGFNINVPLNTTGLGDAEYLAIFNNILLPIAYEFCPDLVLISAGYDAAIGCPEGEMKVTPLAYGHFVNSLSHLAGGKICVVLEGGYCVPSLSEGVAFTLKSLLGDPCIPLSNCEKLNSSCVDSILNVLSVQRPFWDSIKIQNVFDPGFEYNRGKKHTVQIQYAGNPLEGHTTFQTRGYYPVQPPSLVATFESDINELVSKNDYIPSLHQTGFILDPKKEYVTCSLVNHQDSHEDASVFHQKLQDSGLLKHCVYIEPTNSSVSYSSGLVKKIDSEKELSPEVIATLEKDFVNVKLCQNTYPTVTSACESVLLLVDAIMKKMCLNGFALTRPPGHYYENENAPGNNVFSSAVVATKYLLHKYKLDKILIIDLDVKRRSPVQNFFYEDNRVLYISISYQDNECTLSTSEVRENQIGVGAGKGYSVNIPFHHSIQDGDYLAALFHVILPISYEFCPQFTFVSLSYDNNENESRLSSSCYSVMLKLLQSLSSGKILLISEHDFSCQSGPDTAAYCLSTLLNNKCVPVRPSKPTVEGCDTIRNILKIQKDYWKSLAFDVELPNNLSNAPDKEATQPNKSSASLRRQSSDPVAIPKHQNDFPVTISMEIEMEDDFLSDSFFCVTPLENCPHLELLQPLPSEGLNVKAVCLTCNDPKENWVCLHCYQVYCGRFINQHMLMHGLDMKHYLTLSYSDLSVWCYACESYIHNSQLQSIKQHAHDKKFNV